MPIPGEGVFQRRILRLLKTEGGTDRDGFPIISEPELREHLFGTRSPCWTENWTLERALRSLAARGRIRRYVTEPDPNYPIRLPRTRMVRYERNSGIPEQRD